MTRRLPRDYTVRLGNEHFIDSPNNVVHQQQVYELVRHLAGRSACSRIVDIGCGSARKLRGLDETHEVVCIDATLMKPYVAGSVPRARFIECDLDNGLPDTGGLLEDAIVVCADVIEHLRQPEVLLRQLAAASQNCAYLLISTPDRARTRGFMDAGPPVNPAHTMEWTADELGRFVLDCGFSSEFFLGYTQNNDYEFAKSTILLITGREATFRSRPERPSVAGIVNVYNESDVLEHTCRHLQAGGIEVHILDSGSTDGSFEIAQSLYKQGVCANVLCFPEISDSRFDQQALLLRTADYGSKLNAEWIMHCDADEFMSPPWRFVSLRDAISHVDHLGYSAIASTMLRFGFTLKDNVPFFPDDYRFFDFGRQPIHLNQVKAWKNAGQTADLASSGGRAAALEGRRVYPLNFLTRRYPIRSPQTASPNGSADRLAGSGEGRWSHGGREPCNIQSGELPPWREHGLRNYDPIIFASEFLVERLSGIGIETDSQPTSSQATAETTVVRSKEVESMLEMLREENAKLADSYVELRKELASLRASTSWRVTAPVRRLMRLINKS